MEHKKLSRWLILAGVMAVVGICIVFFPHELSVWGMGRGLLGLPYLLAIALYFRISLRIGKNRSFCEENVRDMGRIARLLYIACALWLAGMVLKGFANSGSAYAEFDGIYNALVYAVFGLAAMASLALGILAQVLSRLLNRAATLQADSDLTI